MGPLSSVWESMERYSSLEEETGPTEGTGEAVPPLQNDGTAAPKEFRGAGNSSTLEVRRSGCKPQLCHLLAL